MNKNKGFSLVEMLIVIAIMAILSGLAFVSVGLIRKAKAQDALTTFNSQLNKAWLYTKSVSSSEQSMYFVLESDGGDGFNLKRCDKDASGAVTTEETTSYPKWNRYVTIKYYKNEADYANGTVTSTSTDDAFVGFTIQFKKSTGEVMQGAGVYQFLDKSGTPIGDVHLDPVTGNHYIK